MVGSRSDWVVILPDVSYTDRSKVKYRVSVDNTPHFGIWTKGESLRLERRHRAGSIPAIPTVSVERWLTHTIALNLQLQSLR